MDQSKREGSARRTASLTGPGWPRAACTFREKENSRKRDEDDICLWRGEAGRGRGVGGISEPERLPGAVEELGAAQVRVAVRGQILSVAGLHPYYSLGDASLNGCGEAAAAGRDARE